MKANLFFSMAILTLACSTLFSQTTSNIQQAISINTDGAAPDTSAILDIQSTVQGMLVPRMTTAERTAIASPATSLLVFDTDIGSFWFYNGADWQEVGADDLGNHTATQNINLNGNFLSGDGGNEGVFVDASGNVGIGTSTPSCLLDVLGSTYGVKFRIFDLPTTGGKRLVAGLDGSSFGPLFRFQGAGSGFIDIGQNPEGSFVVEANTATRLVVESSGNVGIGTTSPANKLSVAGSGDFTGNVGIGGTVTATAFVGDGSGLTNLPGDNLGDHTATENIKLNGNYLSGDGGNEGVFVDNLGNVGIGTNSPVDPLHLNAYGYGFSHNAGDIVLATFVEPNQSPGAWIGTYSNHPFFLFTNDSDLPNMTLTPDGNTGIGTTSPTNMLSVMGNADFTDSVGIGTSSPKKLLHVTGDYYGRGQLWLYATAGDGTSGTAYVQARDDSGSSSINMQLRTQNAGSIVEAVHITATGNVGIGTNSPANKLSVTGSADFTGNVGIGTVNPTKAKVEISGTQSATLNYGFLNSSGGTGTSSGTNNYSLYASGRIAAAEFNAFSDARIKNVLGPSNTEQDLSTLMGIEITDYTMLDTLARGTQSHKKVIAQQVEKVFPQAVSTITDVVPDIYQRAEVVSDWIILATDLKPGDRVKIITEQSAQVYEVSEAEAGRFRVAELKTQNPKLKTVFVYGRAVDDFHTVDYEAIAMLNVSATQEQQRRIENLEAENKLLKQRISELDQLEAMVQQLQQSMVKVGLESNNFSFTNRVSTEISTMAQAAEEK